jgi:hypothetical protein
LNSSRAVFAGTIFKNTRIGDLRETMNNRLNDVNRLIDDQLKATRGFALRA